LIYLIRIALFYYTRSPSSDKAFLEFSDSLTRGSFVDQGFHDFSFWLVFPFISALQPERLQREGKARFSPSENLLP